MLARQCTMITSFSRELLFKKFLSKQNRFVIPAICRCDIGLRSVRTRSIKNASETPVSSEIRMSQGPSIPQQTKTSNINSEELLEKLIAGMSTDIHQKNRVYKNDFVRILNKVKELNFSSKKQGLLLIRCCTELLPDEAPASRLALVEQVWSILKPHTKFEVQHYNELLQVYIANNKSLTVSKFMHEMGNVKPNVTTFELILRALGEMGDVNQATEALSNMKALGFPATESVFNSLIVCQGKAGNMKGVQEVLVMMKSLKMDRSVETYTALARVYAWQKKFDVALEEMKKAEKNGLKFNEHNIMDIVKTLAYMNDYGQIPKALKFLPEEILNSPSISPYMQSVSTLLVFQNHPMVALEIYKCLPLPSFGPKDDQGLHGRSLVRDCVKASMPSSIIALIAQQLMSSGRNPIALQNASEAALQQGKVPLALDLFTRMKQIGLPLRPHYFWPILIHTSKSYGEKGIMNTLSTMSAMDVKPDYETILNYTIPYVSFTSPQNLMKKFMETGLSASAVLTPVMEALLNTGQVRAASEICELFNGKVDAEKILSPLLKGYLTNSDVKSTVHILEDLVERASEPNKDWTGRFLCNFMKHKKVKVDLTDFLGLVKALASTNIRISTTATDYCMSLLSDSDQHPQQTVQAVRDALGAITDERLADEWEVFAQHLPHPKQMNEQSLRAHLNELEAKGMNTRGALRKLLQQYCREGNLPAAREIADKCQAEGVFLSAGMKAAIFDLHVKLGELDLAEASLADLNKTAPNFTLDEFKVIDFATLMVYRKKIKQAFDLIKEQSKKRRVIGGRNISLNCWRLLDATAAQGGPADTRRMFELLHELRYCRPANSVLGPLVRAHLKSDNLQEAVNEFSRLAAKYNKTPLKHELVCRALRAMGDGSEDAFLVSERVNSTLNKLVQTVLSVTKRVHGPSDVQLTLIVALAEVGYKKTLRKLFLDPTVKFHPDALLRYCERFADEKKTSALENIAECAKDLRHFDVGQVYNMILDVYQREDDCQGALSLWYKMQEADVTPSQKFIRTLCSLCKANNKNIPSDVSMMLDKESRQILNESCN